MGKNDKLYGYLRHFSMMEQNNNSMSKEKLPISYQFETYKDYSKARDLEVQEEENKQLMTEAIAFVLNYRDDKPEFEGYTATSTLAKMLVDFINHRAKQDAELP